MILDLEGFRKLLGVDFGYVYPGGGLTFVNKDLNMVATSKFEMLDKLRINIHNTCLN